MIPIIPPAKPTSHSHILSSMSGLVINNSTTIVKTAIMIRKKKFLTAVGFRVNKELILSSSYPSYPINLFYCCSCLLSCWFSRSLSFTPTLSYSPPLFLPPACSPALAFFLALAYVRLLPLSYSFALIGLVNVNIVYQGFNINLSQ